MRSSTLMALSTVFLAGSAMGQVDFQTGFTEDMEGHGLGGPLGAPWVNWFCTPGLNDAEIVDTQAHSGTQSMLADTLFDGSIDKVVWDDTPPTSGLYEISAWYFVPGNAFGTSWLIALNQYDTGCNGATTNWSLQVRVDGDLDEIVSDFGDESVPLIRDRWFEIKTLINLDADCHDIYVDGVLLVDDKSWAEGVSGGGLTQIVAFDNFHSTAIGIFVDDIVIRPGTEDPCGTGTICADTFVLVNGIESSGAFADACGSDDARWTLSSTTFDAVFSPAPINLEVTGNVGAGGATLTFTMEGHPTFGGGTAFITVALFNYSTGLFEQSVFAGQADGPPDAVYSKTVDNSGGDYVDVDGSVRARITGAKTAAGPVRLNIDDMFWN